MTHDPIDPAAKAVRRIPMTKAQVRQLAEFMEKYLAERGRLDSVRLEQLTDGYLRAVLIEPNGDPVDEQLLWPTAPSPG